MIYISFSGGKDSTVLLDIARNMYPDIEAVFCDTGLEYPEVRELVKSIDNVTWIKPSMSFKRVIEREGYPVVSKKISRMIRDLQNPTSENQNVRNLHLTGITSKGYKCSSQKLPQKWYKLIDAPFKVSEKCCDHLKKNPMKEYEKATGKKPIIGTMASESKMREEVYLKTGCNSFVKGREKSTPLGFWTEQDILQYIKQNNLKIASVYGRIKEKQQLEGQLTIEGCCGELELTGLKRTGCMFCLFGCHLEKNPNRFQRMKAEHPKQYDYCINKLGIGEILDYIGVDYK